MKAYLGNLKTKTEKLISSFGGLNTAVSEFGLSPSESPLMQNISAVANGALSPCEERTVFASADGEVQFIGVFEGKYISAVIKQSGSCYWKYYDSGWVTICQVDESPTGRYDMLKFIDKTILVTGKVYQVSGIEKTKSYWARLTNGTVTSGNKTVMPAADMIETINGRICAAYTQTDKLYLGGIMDSDVWFDIADGLDENIITQDGENGEAIAAYADHIVYLKGHSVSELYGNTPDTYKMITVSESIGCIAGKTVCSDRSLIWLSGKGVCIYSGGAAPKVISGKIEKYIQNLDRTRLSEAVAGTDGRRYIICLPQIGGSFINCVLNIDTGEWFCEDTQKFVGFAKMGDVLYAATENGIYTLWQAETCPEWSWDSKVWRIAPAERENISRVNVIADIDGEMTVTCINDRGETAQETFTGGRTFAQIRLHPSFFHANDTFKLRLSGEGKCKVYAVEVKFRSA